MSEINNRGAAFLRGSGSVSNTTAEVVASLKVPIGVRALVVITKALSKEYGPGLCMQETGQLLEFIRDVPKEPEAVTDGMG